MEESELGREGLADGFRVSTGRLDPVSVGVVDGDELRHAGRMTWTWLRVRL